MHINHHTLHTWSRASIILGGSVWLSIAVANSIYNPFLSIISLLLLFAILVLAPLALPLFAAPDRCGHNHGVYTAALLLQPWAAVCATGAFFLPVGPIAALLASAWLVFTLLAALFGMVRLLPRNGVVVAEVCLDAALLYLPVGGSWLVLSRLGARPLGFAEPIVALTAVHFHYIGLAALVTVGMVGRVLRHGPPPIYRLYRYTAWTAIVGPALVAAGIAFSLVLEGIAAVVFAASMALIALLVLRYALLEIRARLARFLIVLSAVALLAAMAVATSYALGRLTGIWNLTIPYMLQFHGVVNAFGFGLCSVLGWRMATPRSQVSAAGIPFSKLASRGKVGPGYFQRIGAVKSTRAAPHGLVDDLDAYRRPDFAPEQLDPQVRAFYEATDAHDLLVYPEWQFGFRRLAYVYKVLSSYLGQMNFPLSAERTEDHISSRILPIDDRLDGRSSVRAWVRTYQETGQAVYVAAYSNHSDADQTYMNIAFPLPAGNLTSILRLDLLNHAQGAAGIRLTSFPAQAGCGDAGVYFATRWLAIRLPINETICVSPKHVDAAASYFERPFPASTTIVARHDMWLWRWKFLTLYYAIFPKHEPTADLTNAEAVPEVAYS